MYSAAYSRTKNPTTDTFLEEVIKKRMFKNFENSRKVFAKLFFFSNVVGLQPRISDLTKKRTQENVFFQCSEIVGILP